MYRSSFCHGLRLLNLEPAARTASPATGNKPIQYYYQWSEHGDKWQLIRACIELAELDKNPNHKSTLICEIDQSTSCLQHIAMISGDMNLAL